MTEPVFITASYAFFPIPQERLAVLRDALKEFGTTREMKGLVLIATEGVNSTVSGSAIAISEWKEKMRSLAPDIVFKDSCAERPVFKRWSVKIKSEIVAIKQSDIRASGKHRHVSPEDWNAMLSREDVVVIDTRNDYEVEVGKFRGAVNPGIKHFSQFPAYVKNAGIPKNKKVLMYCTGGIRCEKAIYAMEKEGYTDVYQLEGGILGYLEKFPEGAFEGECFVFDHRVAVDGHLRPSTTYILSPVDGNPVRRSVTHAT